MAVKITSTMDSLMSAVLLPSHSDHDSSWQICSSTGVVTCLACMVECLEDEDCLVLKKKRVISELLRVFTAHGDESIRLLNRDIRVTAHLIIILIEVAKVEDESCVSLALEAIFQVVILTKSEHLVCCILDTVSHQSLKLCNYKKCVPMLSLVGRLLHAIPALAQQFIMGYGSLVDYLSVGLSYPETSAQVAIVYIFLHLYTGPASRHLPAELGPRVAHSLLNILCSTQPQELHMNAIGLLKVMVENPNCLDYFMHPVGMGSSPQSGSQPSLTAALKRLLLGRNNLLQVAAVMCTTAVISHRTRGQHYAELLLQEDIAEFLFETLTTSNEFLIGSVFKCLVLLTDVEAFFKKYHAVYGIEAIMRAVDQAFKLKASDEIQQGMMLLALILDKHPGNIRLFNNAGLVLQCLTLAVEGATHSNPQIILPAVEALCSLLSRQHMPSPVPYGDLTTQLQAVTNKTKPLAKMRCKPSSKPDRRQGRGKAEAVKAWLSQQQLLAYLRVLSRACLLTETCRNDPTANIASFTTGNVGVEKQSGPGQPVHQLNQSKSDLDSLVDSLIIALADTALPLVVENLSYLDDGQVFNYLFSAMNTLWKVTPEKMKRFAKRLLAVGFIGFILNVRVQLRRECENEVVDLLTNIYLSEGNHTTQDEQMFRKGLVIISGSCEGLSTVLTQSSAVTADDHLQCTQGAVLSLLVLAATYGDRSLSPGRLSAALSSYLDIHKAQLEDLPASMLGQIVFLVAFNSSQTPAELPAGIAFLVTLLQRVASADTWCRNHPSILRWSFSHPTITESLAPSIVEYCLKDTDEAERSGRFDGTEPVHGSMSFPEIEQLLVSIAATNHQCLETLMVLLSSRSHAVVGKVVHVLSNLLRDKPEPTGGAASLLRIHLPRTLHTTLLASDNSDTADQHVEAMLELLVAHRSKDYTIGLAEMDTKLAYHVSKLLTRDKGNVSVSLERAALNFIMCLLIQSSNRHDNRVPSILLSNGRLLRHLESTLRDFSHILGMVVTGLLAELHYRFQLQAEQSIPVEEGHILKRLTSAHSNVQAACLRLWTAIFRTRRGWERSATTGSLSASGSREALLTLLRPAPVRSAEDEYVAGLPSLSSRVLRTVLIHSLQCMTQENVVVQENAMDCFEAMIACVGLHKELKEHLVEQPWIYLVLQVIDSRRTENVAMSPSAVRLCQTLTGNLDEGDNKKLAERLLRHQATTLRTIEDLPKGKPRSKPAKQLVGAVEETVDGRQNGLPNDAIPGKKGRYRIPIIINGCVFDVGDTTNFQKD